MEQLNPFAEPPENPSPALPGENERLLAAACYVSQVLVPGILPAILLLAPETRGKPFLRYHGVHSLASLLCVIIYYLAAAVVFSVGAAISVCLIALLWALFLPPLIALGYLAWHAYRGEQFEVPWLTGFLRANHWL